MKITIHGLLAVAILTVPAVAAAPPTPESIAKTIAPMIGEGTVLVVRIDVERIKMGDVVNWLAQAPQGAGQKYLRTAQDVMRWQRGFLRAKAKEFYLLVDYDQGEFHLSVVAPIPPGANYRHIIWALHMPIGGSSGKPPGPFSTKGGLRRNGMYVVGATTPQGYIYQKNVRARPRPYLVEALRAAGDAPIQVAYLPNKALRRAIAKRLAGAKPPLGPTEGKLISTAVRWAGLGLTPPTSLSGKLTIQMSDARAANDGLKLIVPLRELMIGNALRQLVPDIDRLAANLTPTVRGSRLVLAANDKTLTDLMVRAMPPLVRAWKMSKAIISTARVRGFAAAISAYASDNGGAPPASLDVLVQKGLIKRELLSSPLSGPGAYIYIRPPNLNKIDNPGKLIVLFEQPSTHGLPFTAVAFADSSTRTLPVDAQTKALVQRARALSEQTYGKSAPVSKSDALVIYPGQGIGGAKFGMSRAEVIEQLGPTEGDGTSSATTMWYDSKGFIVNIQRKRGVFNIRCCDSGPKGNSVMSRFNGKTPEGIGIGSSRSEIVAAYGSPSREMSGTMLYGKLRTSFILKDGVVNEIVLNSKK